MSSMDGGNEWRKGMLYAVSGILLVSPDPLLVRYSLQLSGSLLTVLFFKDVFVALLLGLWTVATEKELLSRSRGSAFKYLASLSVLKSFIGMGFTLGFIWTYAARVLLCYSINPIWSAVLGWIFLNDALPRRTIVALFVAVIATAIIFLPSAMHQEESSTTENAGTIIAISIGFAFSFYILLARAGNRHCKKGIPLPLAVTTGAMTGAIGIAVFAAVTGESVTQGTSWLFFIMIALDAFCTGTVMFLIGIAARYLPAAQIGLVSLLDIIFGSLLVFFVFNEVPPLYTICGGALLFITLLVHEYLALMEHYRSHQQFQKTEQPAAFDLSVLDEEDAYDIEFSQQDIR